MKPGPDPATLYTDAFFRAQRDASRRSAEAIVPIVLDLLRPRSVIDVGCGVGTWLAVFAARGVADICGVDGAHVDRRLLQIPPDRFLARDLRRRLRIGRRFDLVVSLEVAEHLPARCARGFVDSLTSLGSAVLFSAAIPFQGGHGHVNEQWPAYWAARFRARGYTLVDGIRQRVWDRADVEWWYAQNILLFVRDGEARGRPRLRRELAGTAAEPLALVHPRKYLEILGWWARVEAAQADIASAIPADVPFVLVDQGQLSGTVSPGRRVRPFLEREGRYWGPPPDDATAIRELERLRRSGAGAIVFAWPAFWWLDHYAGFLRHLRSRFPCRLDNDRVVVFDLRARRRARGGRQPRAPAPAAHHPDGARQNAQPRDRR